LAGEMNRANKSPLGSNYILYLHFYIYYEAWRMGGILFLLV
jgi:hypothetical protein